MRNILFKAMRIDNGKWVEGYLLKDGLTGQFFIHAYGESVNESNRVNEEGCLQFVAFEVDENTICQFTGLTDKNGNKIWEHDIVKGTFWGFMMPVKNYTFKISWQDGVAGWCRNVMDDDNEVIGNIFDNPELLKE